jgi:hypothetical protein
MCVIEIGLNDQSFRPVHWACLFLFGLCVPAAAPGSVARGGSGRAVCVVHAWLQIVHSHCMTIFFRSCLTAERRVQTPCEPHWAQGPLIL